MEKSKAMDTKKFLESVLGNLKIKSRNVKYLLNFMVMSDSLLKRIKFVSSEVSVSEDKMDSPQVVFFEISVNLPGEEDVSRGNDFYYKDCVLESVSPDVSFSRFQALMKSGEVVVMLKLNLPPGEFQLKYYELLDEVDTFSDNVPDEIVSAASNVIEEMGIRYELDTLMGLVDRALDSGDRKAFKKYSKQYNEYYEKVKDKISG